LVSRRRPSRSKSKATSATPKRSRQSSSEAKLKFKNPPINELVVGVYFERDILQLRSEHVGLFWGTIRESFPKIQQQSPISRPNIPPLGVMFEVASPGEVFPLPRFWLEDADSCYLIQIQKNAFLLNWRRRDAAYPHFEVVKEKFDENFKLYKNFLKRELGVEPTIQMVDLNYVNVIHVCDYWRGPSDTSKIIPSFRLPVAEAKVMEHPGFNQLTMQKFSQSLTVTTGIRLVRMVTTKEPALHFELRAVGLIGSGSTSEADRWFEHAHEVLGDCFVKMTNPAIQKKYWKRLS
jgi:uncharacterized protein (TIGR04255 family)